MACAYGGGRLGWGGFMLGRCSAAALEEEGGRCLALEWAEAVL